MTRFSKTRRFSVKENLRSREFEEDDPLNGIANLFDVGVVFIVGLLLALFTAYHLQDLFEEDAEFTMMKQSANGELEIITKTKKELKAVKVSKQQAEGRGERLGTAYKLEDGTMVYVPE